MTRLMVAAIAATLIGAACDNPTFGERTSGVFVLQRHNGEQLPVVYADRGFTLIADTIYLDVDGLGTWATSSKTEGSGYGDSSAQLYRSPIAYSKASNGFTLRSLINMADYDYVAMSHVAVFVPDGFTLTSTPVYLQGPVSVGSYRRVE